MTDDTKDTFVAVAITGMFIFGLLIGLFISDKMWMNKTVKIGVAEWKTIPAEDGSKPEVKWQWNSDFVGDKTTEEN